MKEYAYRKIENMNMTYFSNLKRQTVCGILKARINVCKKTTTTTNY